MQSDWPTREEDLKVAAKIIEDYMDTQDTDSLGLFEVVMADNEDLPDFRLSEWVVVLAEHFHTAYGKEQGDYVTKMVVSRCLTSGHTIH